MASNSAEKNMNMNKPLMFGCMMAWSVCIGTYAYQYMGGFVHWPYWCLIHLFSLFAPISATIIGSTPLDSPPSPPMRLGMLLFSLYMPFCTASFTITPEVRVLDWVYVFLAFFVVDWFGCISIATLTRLKYTHYWPLICLVFGLAFSSGYGLRAAAADPLWCKIVVCCSAVAVAAFSTLYLYLRRRQLVSDETPRVTFARCFV